MGDELLGGRLVICLVIMGSCDGSFGRGATCSILTAAEARVHG